jgi:ribosomal protein S18 acetylase RimI-like enzyme
VPTGVTPFFIRRLAPADAQLYQAHRLRGLREHPDAFTSSFEEEKPKPLAWSASRLAANADRPHDFFLGAFKNDALGGAVGLQGRYRTKECHNASLVGMYVAPELAGQGAGRALVLALVQQAREFAVLEQIDLTVTAGNDRAQQIYEGCGFTVFGVLPSAIWLQSQYYAKVYMVLRLR